MLSLDTSAFSNISPWPLLLGALGVLCYVVARGLRCRKEAERLPPSPPGHWLFGNAPPTA